MQAIGTHTMARRIADFGRARKTRLYYAAGICLLVAAAGPRFHDLAERQLSFDDAATANYSRGTFSEVISNTRHHNSSPILYPLILYTVQKVESTIFSVRIVPATASLLTIALMLFLLPRLGVARGAAFLAALLATLSVEAIRHAQDVREYSIDALLALLMVAGLLRYLRDGRTAPLCVFLFLAPLLQYGLVLFGATVIGAAVVAPCVSAKERPSGHPGPGIGDWLKKRLDLAAPCGFFLAGGALSYLVTVRYQWHRPLFGLGGYLSPYYYQGEFDAYSIFEFSIDGIWSLLKYHLPEVVAMAALPAFAILLVAAFLRKFQYGVIAVLFSFCIAVSVGAAVLGIYPLGGIRQGIYLGPIIFLAVGLAFHSGADALASTARQAWLGPLLIVLSASAIVLSGVDALRRIDLYPPHDKGEEIVAVLLEHTQEDDVLFYSGDMRHLIEFHGKPNMRKVFYGKVGCWIGEGLCLQEMIDEITPSIGRSRLWLVSYKPLPFLGMLQTMAGHVLVKHVVSGGTPNLYLIEDAKSLIQIAAATEMFRDIKPMLPSEPLIRTTFDIYLHENMLVYFKEPCGAEDMQATFFLHYEPVDGDDLPADRRQYGFDGVHFNIFKIQEYGIDRVHATNFKIQVMSAEQCFAWQELPDYAIALFRTGQFLGNEDGSYANLWEEELRSWLTDYESIASGEPAARSDFDIYLRENTVAYLKSPCSAADVRAEFFLHIIPEDLEDLPADRRQYGFGGANFRYGEDAALPFGGQCIMEHPLPDYPIARIRTGQFTPEGDQIWVAEFPVGAVDGEPSP